MKTDIAIMVNVEAEDELAEADAIEAAKQALNDAGVDYRPPFYQSGCKRISYNEITVFFEQ